MSLVIDASVALKWVLNEPDANAADALRAERLIAPSLWLVEAANALWRYVSRGDLSVHEARARLALLRTAPVHAEPVEADIAAALDLAAELRHPVYDCLYLALALREDATVVTADRRFHGVVSAAAAYAPRIRLLGAG